jgi:hypothetical protein
MLVIEGEKDLTVGSALEGIFFAELFLDGAEAVDFAVADDIVAVKLKGLHALGG